jgi:hypothetical protein
MGIPALLVWQFIEGRRFLKAIVAEQANPTGPR